MALLNVPASASPEIQDLVNQLNRFLGGRVVPAFSKTNLPKAKPDWQLIGVPDDAGGPVLAYSYAGQWLKSTDGTVVS